MRAAVVVLVLLLCSVLYAHSMGDVRWRYWKAEFSGKYSFSTDTLGGTSITQRLLDYNEDKPIDRFDTMIYMRSCRLSISLWEVLYKGGKTLTTPTAFGGKLFDADYTHGKLRLSHCSLRFEFDVLHSMTQARRTLMFAFGGGLHFLRIYSRMKGKIGGIDAQDVYRRNQVIPYLSVSAYSYIGSAGKTGEMFVGASIVASAYSHSDSNIDLDSFTEVSVFFQYGSSSAFRFGLIRSSLDMEHSNSKSFKIRYHIDGWFIGVLLGF